MYEVGHKLIIGNDEQIRQILSNAGYDSNEIDRLLHNHEELKTALKKAGCSDETIEELTEVNLGKVVVGQFKTLLSFKALGRIFFMHKVNALPPEAVRLSEENDLKIEPKLVDNVQKFEITYPDGTKKVVDSMDNVIALSNAHYEKVTLLEPLKAILDRDKSFDIDDNTTIRTDGNGNYTLTFKNEGKSVSSKNLRELIALGQSQYNMLQMEAQIKKDGQYELRSGLSITLDRRTGEYLATLEDGTKLYSETVEDIVKQISKIDMCKKIESGIDQRGMVLINPFTFVFKDGDEYSLTTISGKGLMTEIRGTSVKDVIEKAERMEQSKTEQSLVQKQEFSLSEKAGETGVISDNAQISRTVDTSKFETTEEGLTQILEEFNKFAATYYFQHDINNIKSLFDKDPEFVMNLLKEQLQIEIQQPIADYMLSARQIEQLMELKKW